MDVKISFEMVIRECRKCGGTPILESEFKPSDGRCWVRCEKCGMHSAWHDNAPGAILDWNERMERKNLRVRKEK